MQLHYLDTGLFKLDGGAMFGVVPKSIWHRLNPADDNNMCTWAMRCLLLEHGERLILVDTGIGRKQDARFFSHYYLHGEGSLEQAIRQAGFHESEVTDVLLTHLHFDHVGGAAELDAEGKAQPTFTNARYWTARDQWALALQPNAREKASFLAANLEPLAQSGQLSFVDDEGDAPFGPQVELLRVSGHTEAMLLPRFTAGGQEYLFCADLLPSAHHIPLPYVMGYDMRPLLTMEEKQRILAESVARGTTLIFEHDHQRATGDVVQTEKGIRLAV